MKYLGLFDRKDVFWWFVPQYVVWDLKGKTFYRKIRNQCLQAILHFGDIKEADVIKFLYPNE